ncbi:MAG: type IV toxin-antitoxin system AbiEi family antitoxin domain-containing protein, partial [Pseudonocardia sp.]|nr:type IV toxin-antitoxin system AbiEi family antitoxin domain-containing protein [Pseudonocardia sp.]
MIPRIEGLMSTQHGLITRRQAVDGGLRPDAIDRMTRSGRWVIVRRGVYAERSMWDALTRPEEQQRTRDRAASLRIRAPHVMSHDSAALELDLPVLRPGRPMTHVTRPGVVGSHLRHGVKHHLAPYVLSQVVVAHGIAVLGPARTAADLAREHGFTHGVVAFDSALRMGAAAHEVEEALEAMTYWPGVPVARAAWDAADPGTDSIGESLSRLLVEALGHGRPQTQFGLTDGSRTVFCDLRLGRQVFEFDGHLKYQRVEDG